MFPRKSEGVSVTADVMRFQAQGSELQGIRLFAVNNTSVPPRTQMSDQHFEFFLPESAQIDQAMAMTAGGQPINSSPVPEKEKNRYGFVFPLRPGETQFQVVFHLPYSGELNVDPKPLYGAQHFVVMVPKTMQFTAAPGPDFKAMKDPRQSDALVQVASNTQAGQPLAFKISGTGALGEAGDDSQGAPTTADGGERCPWLDAIPVPAGTRPAHRRCPILWRNIAGTFSVASGWRWWRGRFTLPNAPEPRLVPDFGTADVRLPETLPVASLPDVPDCFSKR